MKQYYNTNSAPKRGRQSPNFLPTNQEIDIFEKIAEICPDIRLIVGNHDIYNKSSNDITTLNILKYIKGVKISEFSVKDLSDKVQEYLQLPEIKHHCSSYAGAAINLALKNVQN